MIKTQTIAQHDCANAGSAQSVGFAHTVAVVDEGSKLIRLGHGRSLLRNELRLSSAQNVAFAENRVICHDGGMSSLPERLRNLIDERGTNASALSLEIGAGREAVRMILRGNSQNPRMDTLVKLARALDVSVAYLTGAEEDRGEPPTQKFWPPSEERGLPIRFRVQAGSFYNVDEADEPIGWARITADPRFPIAQQWVEEVVGDSIDRIYPSGSMLLVLDVVHAPTLRLNQLVVVARSIDGGMIERTVKRVVEIEGALYLVGESNNAKWNKPVRITGDDDSHISISVAGIVIGGYRAEPF